MPDALPTFIHGDVDEPWGSVPPLPFGNSLDPPHYVYTPWGHLSPSNFEMVIPYTEFEVHPFNCIHYMAPEDPPPHQVQMPQSSTSWEEGPHEDPQRYRHRGWAPRPNLLA